MVLEGVCNISLPTLLPLLQARPDLPTNTELLVTVLNDPGWVRAEGAAEAEVRMMMMIILIIMMMMMTRCGS